MPFVDFRKTAPDDIVAAFYKGNEVKLIYHGNTKIFESKRLYTTFTAENGYLNIADLSTIGVITELYIDGVKQEYTTGDFYIDKPTSIKIKGQFTVQNSSCDMYDFFMADGLESVSGARGTMFKNCTGITNLDLTYFNTSTVGISFQDLFLGCTSLKTVNIDNFDVNRVVSINSLFNGCEALETVNMSNWKNTNSITNATNVFKNCIELTSIKMPQLPSLTDMQRMFYGCSNLKEIDMSGINSSNLTTVAQALSGVPSDCVVKVSSGFSLKFTPAQLGWNGTFITR